MGTRAHCIVFGLAAALTAASPARAWDNQGHMTTGAIAYDVLMRQDPRLVATIVRLMAAHPDRARFERELQGAPPALRDRRLFEYMARWPDDVRGTAADVEPWHYEVRAAVPWGWMLPFKVGDAEAGLARQTRIAADSAAAPAARAVAFCWIFHVVGDMQQPLHTGYWVNARFPVSDRAGTRAYVRPAPGAAATTLHRFWDAAAMQPGAEAERAEALALRLQRTIAPPRDPVGLSAAFELWSTEGRALARREVYRGGDYRAGPTPARASVLDAAYVARARVVAERRIALGGYRLAALLRAGGGRDDHRGSTAS